MSTDPTPDAGGPGGVDRYRDALIELTLALTMCEPQKHLLGSHTDKARLAEAMAKALMLLNPPVGGASSVRVDKGPALHVSAAHGPASTEPLAELAAPDASVGGGAGVTPLRTILAGGVGAMPPSVLPRAASNEGRPEAIDSGNGASEQHVAPVPAPAPASPVLPAPSSPVTGPAAAGSPSPGGARPCGCGHETWEHTARGCMAKVAVDEWCPCPRWRPATVYEAITEAQERARQRPEDETLEETARRHFLAVE